jgi:hypothetical protein
VSLVRRQRRRPQADILQGELGKMKPPTFNGEHKKGEKVEASLLKMNKYFQLQDYRSRVEVKIATCISPKYITIEILNSHFTKGVISMKSTLIQCRDFIKYL